MSRDDYSDVFFKGPAYALLIGISRYEHGKEPGQLKGGYEFCHLKCPASDANDFAEYLRNNGMIPDNVATLVDDQATLPNIKEAIDDLSRKCLQSQSEGDKPLVIVFFSGHGMVDSKKRHYLLPWEAQGNALYGTALSHGEFWRCLNDINSNRLLVFLDACHSGTTGPEGAMGAAGSYSPMAELGAGEGRYVIASCGPGQYSYEPKEPDAKNSIFTAKLLSLLKCDGADAIQKEEIDIFDLYPVLKDSVKKAAKEYGDQVPMAVQMQSATGIVLAINKYVRDARVKAELQTKQDRQQFLQKACNNLTTSDTVPKRMIRALLKRYINVGEKPERYKEMLDLFDACFEEYRASEERLPSNYCDMLVDEYNAAFSQPNPSNETRSQTLSKSTDEFVRGEPQQLPPSAPSGAFESQLQIPPADQKTRGQLLSEIIRTKLQGDDKIV